jgi:SAM-dependent methyltransferase
VNDPLNPKEFFQQQADAYDRVHYGGRSFMTTRLERTLKFVDDMDLSPKSAVLDAGCGPGHFAISMAGRGFDVRAVDTSEAMLAELSKNVKSSVTKVDIDTQIASIEELPFEDASFDLVCSLGVIEYLELDDKVLREFLRVLRPGGIMILSVTNFWSPAGYLDFFVELAKRQSWFLSMVNSVWTRLGNDEIRPRFFKIRRHRPGQLRKSLGKFGFSLDKSSYFYMLPWPHPLDRLFPGLTDKLGEKIEPLSESAVGWLAEGYIVCARK